MREVIREHESYPLTETLVEKATPPAKIDGIVVGTLARFDDAGDPRIVFPGCGDAIPARSTVNLTPSDLGREVALMFEAGDASKPIVLGLIHYPVPVAPAPTVEVRKDNERLVLTAKESIEFQCGKSSITLTKAGKVLIRGEYLLSRSSGVNRIKGGSVQIN